MSTYQMPLPNFDPLRRLGDVQRALSKIFPDNPPCRMTLISMCEDGTFDSVRDQRNGYYYVYQSSLDDYIRALQSPRQQKLAA